MFSAAHKVDPDRRGVFLILLSGYQVTTETETVVVMGEDGTTPLMMEEAVMDADGLTPLQDDQGNAVTHSVAQTTERSYSRWNWFDSGNANRAGGCFA